MYYVFNKQEFLFELCEYVDDKLNVYSMWVVLFSYNNSFCCFEMCVACRLILYKKVNINLAGNMCLDYRPEI